MRDRLPTKDSGEISRVLKNISISDENKPMMKPAVPVLIKAVDKLPENTKVIKDSIEIFLQFTFDPILLNAIQDSSAALETALKKSNLDADDKAQVKVLQNILNPEQAKQTTHHGSRIGAAVSSLMPSSKPSYQIMISYNLDSQPTVKKIHSELAAAKYKIWFDLQKLLQPRHLKQILPEHQHLPAQHGTAQHGTAQHSTASHPIIPSTLLSISLSWISRLSSMPRLLPRSTEA